ncbi:MAG: hypothetical protein FJW68_01605 [Actinobacteria bacterium]|nr:hypothetical protein [Actinomycetota bacterium]
MKPVHRHIKTIINKELDNLVKLYPYNTRNFYDSGMLHASSMLSFYDYNTSLDASFYSKFLNLMAGMELLALGIRTHSFNPDDFMLLVKDIKSAKTLNKKSIEKNAGKYTLDLLFGDIFYSRASVYIMKYCDHELFNTILESLKSVHKNKLMLHQEMVEIIKTARASNQDFMNNKIIDFINENEAIISGINDLLKTSFITGWGIFCSFDNINFPYSIINDFILLKTYNDLEGFFEKLPAKFSYLKKAGFIQERKKAIKQNLAKRVGCLDPLWLKTNFLVLQKQY